MKLTELVPSAQTQSIFFSWTDAPADTYAFKVYSHRRGAPDGVITDEDLVEMATVSDPHYNDIVFFQKSILKREIEYVIKAVDAQGKVLDTLTVRPMHSESTLIKRVLNAANYKAGLFFRNYNWADTAYILRYRKTGKKCKCYNRDFEEASDPKCTECFGGGYKGGFYTPIPTKILPITQVVKDQDIDEYIPQATDQRQITVPRFPAVYKGDFLVSDRLGYLSIVASSTNTIQIDPTPTLMLTAIELGKEHIVSQYKFEACIPKVTGVTLSNGELVVHGQNIMPILGTISLVITEGPDAVLNKTFNVTSLSRITPSEIAFRVPSLSLGTTNPEVHYRMFLNNMLFEG